MTPRAAELRAAILATVAAGPVRCRDAYAALVAQGFSRYAIENAKAKLVRVVGTTSGAWWYPDPKAAARRERRRQRSLANLEKGRAMATARAERARKAREALAPPLGGPRKARKAPSPPSPRPPRVCRVCELPIGIRPVGADPLCLRCERAKEVAA